MAHGSRQRRAIYTVLRQWLDEAQLLEALALFQERYQGRSSIGMHDYLTAIAPLYSAKVDLKTVRRDLMRMLIVNEADLAPDPLPRLGQSRGATAPKAAPKRELSLAQRALHDLISDLLADLPAPRRRRLQERLPLHLKKGFASRTRDAITAYVQSEDPRHISTLDDAALRQLLTAFYSAACEALGPVETDDLLATALERLRGQDPKARSALNRFL